jgi:GH15 family glucan-1,4-alpha-glucosidase
VAYLPVEDYGIIGNLRTVALIGRNGSVDWFCFPNFDSPSIFARILDDEKGGFFEIAPANLDGVAFKQLYWPETNVLVTRFLTDEGVGEIRDLMPIDAPRSESGFHGLIRIVKVVRGRMTFRLRCQPAFNYARDRHTVELASGGAIFSGDSVTLALAADHALRVEGDGVACEFTLDDQQVTSFELHAANAAGDGGIGLSDSEAECLFTKTIEWWRRWLSHCTYTGRWREMVYRSALLLKLLVYQPTGAMIAAATASLPERIGGERNWDYRYTWIRDASFTIYALLRIGFIEEAGQFMNWIEARCRERRETGPPLQVLYRLDGSSDLTEEILDHLAGYRGSAPVRIGNSAANQLQLDIYGELMDSVYLFNKYGRPISYEMWRHLRELTDWVCENWHRPDEAIWEVRSGRQHFVYSRVMCWVAIDRALRLAAKRSFPADTARWQRIRDTIYEDIQAHGWSSGRQSFVQHYGSESLDASLLVMPLVLFMAPGDPRMLLTLDAIKRPPRERGLVSDGLVYRYNVEEAPDGLRGSEGTFNLCTFWLVEALTRAGAAEPARLDEARLIFEQMLGYANHVGLFAEQTGPRGEALGNFPQAFTHLALISAAFNLDRALGGERRGAG